MTLLSKTEIQASVQTIPGKLTNKITIQISNCDRNQALIELGVES